MGIEEKPKKSPIEKYFFDKMTPEEVADFRKKSAEKVKAKASAKKEAAAKLKLDAIALMPRLLAEEMLALDNEKYIPSNETLERIRVLLETPKMTMDTLRRTHFRELSEKAWEKLTRYLFKDQISGESDLGLQILEQRKQELKRLEKTLRMLNKEIKLVKKDKKSKGQVPTAPFGLLQLRIEAERDLRNYRMDVNKNIFKTNLDTAKAKSSTSVHIHTSIPRPIAPEARDVTPKKVQNLTELVNVD